MRRAEKLSYATLLRVPVLYHCCSIGANTPTIPPAFSKCMNNAANKLSGNIHFLNRGGQYQVAPASLPVAIRRDFSPTACMFVDCADSELLEPEAEALLRRMARLERTFVFLIPRQSPPRFAYREDTPISSFAFTADLLRIWEDAPPVLCNSYCFDLFEILSRTEVDFNVYALQFPELVLPIDASYRKSVRCIVPHFGAADFVPACISSLLRNPGITSSAISVAVDGIPTAELQKCLRTAGVDLHYTAQSGNGPYVLRNLLIARAIEEIAMFQDSDDIACTDRVSCLMSAFEAEAAGLIGSHEIRLDYFQRRVIPIRYPLDVSAALAMGPVHALLHPTSAVNIALFRQAGAFSTFERHSMDSQFLLRFYFYAPIRNVDRFLYIRRWRPGSLCTDSETALGSYYRTGLQVRWGRAFLMAKHRGSHIGTELDTCGEGSNRVRFANEQFR